MKLIEQQDTERALDRLPELPPGVEVPEDISGLQPPATRKPTAGGVRWMRWLVAIVLLGAAGVVTAVLLRSDDADQTPVDYMEVYGTDNPTFVRGGAGPGTVEIVGTEDLMELYGTDNPAFVPEPTYMEQYGTDNPTFIPEPTYMEQYGTDNPVFVPEPTYMEQYGTDNPTFIPEAEADIVDTGEYMKLYGTDNPVFVEP